MTEPQYDAIIIGGGPGGSTAATYLARAGRKVLLLEKAHFPRFHIGESLLPYNQALFEEMGVLDAIKAENFSLKYGAQFNVANSSATLQLRFADGIFTRHSVAFQVERARFDHLLLKHARQCGAEVREGCTVSRVEDNAAIATVHARANGSDVQTLTARYVLDCSGRGNLTGNQEKLRVTHPQLRKVALFAHFDNVRLDEDRMRRSDTVIVCLKKKWFWIIPIGPHHISVGLVMDQQEFAASGQTPEAQFDDAVKSSPEMTDRMAQARSLNPIQATSDFAYYNRRLVGKRVLRVGDAAGFLDPVFSAGVFLAMFSGRLAARTVLASLDSEKRAPRLLARYERRVFSALKYYWDMSLGFYDPPFLELFAQPREVVQVRDAVLAILAGELEGGWKIYWRRKFFFLLVWIQRHKPLVPRLTFD